MHEQNSATENQLANKEKKTDYKRCRQQIT